MQTSVSLPYTRPKRSRKEKKSSNRATDAMNRRAGAKLFSSAAAIRRSMLLAPRYFAQASAARTRERHKTQNTKSRNENEKCNCNSPCLATCARIVISLRKSIDLLALLGGGALSYLGDVTVMGGSVCLDTTVGLLRPDVCTRIFMLMLIRRSRDARKRPAKRSLSRPFLSSGSEPLDGDVRSCVGGGGVYDMRRGEHGDLSALLPMVLPRTRSGCVTMVGGGVRCVARYGSSWSSSSSLSESDEDDEDSSSYQIVDSAGVMWILGGTCFWLW